MRSTHHIYHLPFVISWQSMARPRLIPPSLSLLFRPRGARDINRPAGLTTSELVLRGGGVARVQGGERWQRVQAGLLRWSKRCMRAEELFIS